MDLQILVSASVTPIEWSPATAGAEARRIIRVEEDIYINDETLIGFIKSLNGTLDNIPEEYRAEARIEKEDYDYGSCIKIYYKRPQTDAEMELERESSARYEAQKRDREKLQYERLKKKFDAPL